MRKDPIGTRDKLAKGPKFMYNYDNNGKRLTQDSVNLDENSFKDDKFLNFPIGGCSNELDRIYTSDEAREDLKKQYPSQYRR